MHSWGLRLNALMTFSLTSLGVMCGLVSFSYNFNRPSSSADVRVLNVNWFQKHPDGCDKVSMTMNITADLQSLFTWNTKQKYDTPMNSLNQVSLWDGIIPTREHAKFWIHTANKYRFIDQGSNLRGKEFNFKIALACNAQDREDVCGQNCDTRLPVTRRLQISSIWSSGLLL